MRRRLMKTPLPSLAAMAALALTGAPARAQQPGQQLGVEPAGASRWSLLTQLESASSLHRWGDPNRTAATSLWLWPQFRYSPDFMVSLLAVGEQSWVGRREAQLRTAEFMVRRMPIRLNRFLMFTPMLGLTPPLATGRLTQESLLFSARLAPRLMFDLEPAGLKGLSGFFEVAGARLFHRFETRADGRVNTQHSVNLWFTLNQNLGERAFASAMVMRTSAFSHFGKVTNSFVVGGTVGYALTDRLTLMVSHENAATLLGPDGQSNNFAVVDPETSLLSASISLTL